MTNKINCFKSGYRRNEQYPRIFQSCKYPKK